MTKKKLVTNNKFKINNKVEFRMADISVEVALQSMNLDGDMIDLITKNQSIWLNFGKKTSHTLRTFLMNLMQKAQLSDKARFMIYFFFSVIKNVQRVLNAMEQLPNEMKTADWFSPVKNFVQRNLVQYTNQENSEKFAVVHLPTTNPGLDCLCAALSMPATKRALNEIIRRNTFTQLDISPTVLEINKQGVMDFWNNKVRKSNNRNRPGESLNFHEDYFNTAAQDKYLLVDRNLNEFNEYEERVGMEEKDVEKWFMKVKNVTSLI